ncbi:MAG TPA: hypothetical protein VFJ58_01580 [Armatimonadota bacterium]|nr:hypothetical protein [Armatimonadota bacterium]
MVVNRAALALSLSLMAVSYSGAAPKTPVPTAVWIGQDGKDFTNPSSVLAPNGVQDVHIAVTGLPRARKIDSATLLGYGAGEWHYSGSAGSWRIAMTRAPNSPDADFYFDAGDFDTVRRWNLILSYDNHEKVDIGFAGRKFNPLLRMPGAALRAAWIGQDGSDLTGPGPSVGPDGFQDVHLKLWRLSPNIQIDSVTVTLQPASTKHSPHHSSGKHRRQPLAREPPRSWVFGMNPGGAWNAELERDAKDPSRADLYFSPAEDLARRTLEIAVKYAPGESDSTTVVAGRENPALRMARPISVAFLPLKLTASWMGQDGTAGPGDVHVDLSGVPAGSAIAAAELSDPVGGCWVYRASLDTAFYVPAADEENPAALPLLIKPAGGAADLYFPPDRDETGARMTLRLLFVSGKSAIFQFVGGPCDLSLREPPPLKTTVTAHPGDDLNDLANRFGAVTLAPGTYEMRRPLELRQPVTIEGDPGAAIEFRQPPDDHSSWQTAILIGASNTTLNGFAVRFATPIRWKPEDWVNGPAVIGTLQPTAAHPDPGINISITNMDIESPPLPPGAPLTQEPRLIRLIGATSGRISNNILKGGVTDVMRGPWEIAGNDYRGTVPGSFDYSAFAEHYTHDVSIQNNRVRDAGPSGKNWRFLVMTQSGAQDAVTNNDVRDVGPRDNDTIPNPNASEILLTEAYRLHFEGRPAAIEERGRVLAIPIVQGAPVHTGSVVSILDGPHAGTWRIIAQAIDPTTFLMDSPLPMGDYDVSISTGFVNERYEGNTIDMTGSSACGDMILAGNHFGTILRNNHTIGGGAAFALYATPTERPNIWGWSHAPFLGALIENNTFEDSVGGGTLSVQHSKYIKSDSGRVYFSAILRSNTIRWSDSFLKAHAKDGQAPPAITLGDPGSLDPGEMILYERGNRIESASAPGYPVIRVKAACVNGRKLRDTDIVLAP